MLFYININGIESETGDQRSLQLCQNLQILGVDIISLTETNVHWKRSHIISSFEKQLRETCPNDKLSTYTSELELYWNTDYKSGGKSTISLNKISSSIVDKRHDPSVLGR